MCLKLTVSLKPKQSKTKKCWNKNHFMTQKRGYQAHSAVCVFLSGDQLVEELHQAAQKKGNSRNSQQTANSASHRLVCSVTPAQTGAWEKTGGCSWLIDCGKLDKYKNVQIKSQQLRTSTGYKDEALVHCGSHLKHWWKYFSKKGLGFFFLFHLYIWTLAY